jgi:hypothetical protein
MAKNFSKFFKSKSKQVTIPDGAKSAPQPRSKDDIQKEYQSICTAIGDMNVKEEGLKLDKQNLFRRVQQIGEELSARTELDNKAAAEAAKNPASASETSAPAPQAAT